MLMSFSESQSGSTETLGEGVRNLKLQMVKQEAGQLANRESMENELKDCQLLCFDFLFLKPIQKRTTSLGFHIVRKPKRDLVLVSRSRVLTFRWQHEWGCEVLQPKPFIKKNCFGIGMFGPHPKNL